MKKFCVLFFSLVLTYTLSSQLTIKITSVPADTPQGAEIYIAGTMNNWNPGNPNFKLVKDSAGIYTITFVPATGTVKFKFTRGSWETVEGTASGGFIPDRSVTYSGQPKTVELAIAGWEGVSAAVSTASPQVSVLSDSFYLPQLLRYRRIWLYLPKDYAVSAKSYPVLYMHDGQNLFDRKTSFSGEWRVDESLDSMALRGDYGCIVVGIDNGGTYRLQEYSPWVNSQYGGGQGDEYIDFIVTTLKPYIDSNFRTLKDSDNTAIMGSSMGGLISMYAGIAYPDIFGRIGAFSSSFWFSGASYQQVSDTKVNLDSYFYMIAGAKEGGNQTADMAKMVTTMLNAGAIDQQIKAVAHNDGQHSEWYWAREFPAAYKWLFEKKTSEVKDNIPPKYKGYFDGVNLVISGEEPVVKNQRLNLLDMTGRMVYSAKADGDTKIDLSGLGLPFGFYTVTIGQAAFRVLVW